MLQDLTSVLASAERLADRIADLCERGEPADNELADLGRVVGVVSAGWGTDTPAVVVSRCRALAGRVGVALTAAETRKAVLADELAQLAASSRVRRAYVRSPT